MTLVDEALEAHGGAAARSSLLAASPRKAFFGRAGLRRSMRWDALDAIAP